MGEENSSAFKCVKISLIVLYVLSIIAFIIALSVVVIALVVINNQHNNKITPEEREKASMISFNYF